MMPKFLFHLRCSEPIFTLSTTYLLLCNKLHKFSLKWQCHQKLKGVVQSKQYWSYTSMLIVHASSFQYLQKALTGTVHWPHEHYVQSLKREQSLFVLQWYSVSRAQNPGVLSAYYYQIMICIWAWLPFFNFKNWFHLWQLLIFLYIFNYFKA